jgi:hypothetical protein
MIYHQRIRVIQRDLVMGHRDKQSCLADFEALLHEYGLLPPEEELDKTISDDNFVGLLKLALNYRDPKQNALDQLKDINRMLGGTGLADAPRDSILDSNAVDPFTGMPHAANLAGMIKRRCPVCQKQVAGLYNRVQTADTQVLPIDPPRCEECMTKWMEKEVGYSLRPRDSLVTAPEPTVEKDASPVKDFAPEEAYFFAQFESQMKDFKP